MFYFLLFLTALVQNLLFISTKSFVIFSPNIVLAFLYYHSLKETKNLVLKGAVGGLFLDLMFDTLGLNIAIKSFICYLIWMIREKVVYVHGFYSHLLFFFLLSFIDLLLRYGLIRFGYAIKFDIVVVLISIVIELAVFSLLYAIYKRS